MREMNKIKKVNKNTTLKIDFYLLRTFCPHLGSFCVVTSFN